MKCTNGVNTMDVLTMDGRKPHEAKISIDKSTSPKMNSLIRCSELLWFRYSSHCLFTMNMFRKCMFWCTDLLSAIENCMENTLSNQRSIFKPECVISTESIQFWNFLSHSFSVCSPILSTGQWIAWLRPYKIHE